MRIDAWICCACLALAGCAALPGSTSTPADAPRDRATPERLLGLLAASAEWSGPVLAGELQRLQEAAPRDATARLELAMLLARRGATPEALARAQSLLAGLEEAFAAPGTRQFVLLHQRLVRLELDLRQERRRAAELQDKIERLKDLERNLGQRGKTEEGK